MQQIPIERNSEEIIENRYNYCTEISKLNDRELVFLDESGFNLHTSNNFGYAQAGEVAYISVPANRGRNFSLTTAISNEGIVAYALFCGPINGELFLSFLDVDFMPRVDKQKIVLIMDNAKIHHVLSVENWASQNEIRIMYLPPYSPQLNPVENLFSSIKMKYNTIRPRPKTTEELRSAIIPVLDGFVYKDLTGYYAKMRDWVEKGINKELFI